MSSFTRDISIRPVRVTRKGFWRLLPPGLLRARWEVADCFEYAVGSLDEPSMTVRVLEGFRFDGATVPFVLRHFFPMAHPDYMQAAALHDWLLTRTRLPRLTADRIFIEALGVLDMPRHWRACFFLAVRVGAALAFVRRIGGAK